MRQCKGKRRSKRKENSLRSDGERKKEEQIGEEVRERERRKGENRLIKKRHRGGGKENGRTNWLEDK